MSGIPNDCGDAPSDAMKTEGGQAGYDKDTGAPPEQQLQSTQCGLMLA
jgi:hypothetical protein